MNKKRPPACTCASCQRCCQFHPGYFLPPDYKKFAKRTGLGHMVISDEIGVHPRTKNGERFGECVFFSEGRCRIHEVKPYSCKMADHTGYYGVSMNQIHEIWMAEDK